MNILALQRRQRELAEQAHAKTKAHDAGQLTQKAYIAGVEAIKREYDEVTDNIKAYGQAQRFSANMCSGAGQQRQPSGIRGKAKDLAPLGFGEDQLKAMHEAVRSRQSFALHTKAASTVDSLLPAELQQTVVGPQYEARLLDRLPVQPTSAPSWEYIRHTSTTGTPGIVAEGEVKPELVFNTDKITVVAQKLAANTATSWESLQDWDVFVNYVTNELMRQVVNVENAELIAGDGTADHLTGFLSTSGILTRATGTDTPLDAVEEGIADLRVGAALAEANLFVVHPNTWSALRRVKDTQGRYLVDPDPTNAAGSQLWGVEVLPTTQIAAGTGALLDTRKAGYVVVREALSLRTGTSDDDFVRNLVRWISEERLALAVERPSAVCKVTGLPTA